jgi:hypothetical protein
VSAPVQENYDLLSIRKAGWLLQPVPELREGIRLQKALKRTRVELKSPVFRGSGTATVHTFQGHKTPRNSENAIKERVG